MLAEVIARVGTGLHYALAALVGEPFEAVGVILLCVVCAADIVDRAAQPPIGERARVELGKLKRSEPCEHDAQQNRGRKQDYYCKL